MNRKQKKELRQRQSTRQLMGIVRVTPHGIVTDSGERVFFLIQPDNLYAMPPEVIRGRGHTVSQRDQLRRRPESAKLYHVQPIQ